MTPDGPFINCEMAAISDLYEQYPLDRQSWLRVFDYTTQQGLRLQERVPAGCYVSIMGHSDALGGDYPEVPSSFYRNRCLVAVLPEDYLDHVVLPAGDACRRSNCTSRCLTTTYHGCASRHPAPVWSDSANSPPVG